MTNQGWYLERVRTLKKVALPIPAPSPHEVVIEVGYVGICGSDLHAYTGEHPLVPPGRILGHEVTGRIFAVGEEVEGLKVGDAVVIEPSITCGSCYNCAHGRYNICSNLQVIGCIGYDGGLQKFVAVPAQKVYPLGSLSLKLGTLVEPLAVGVHAVRLSTFKPGAEVLVIGAGPIGLLTAGFLSLAAAKKIVITDLIDERLRLAKALIKDITISKPDDVNQVPFSFGGPDVIFECVGADTSINTAIETARKGSEIVLVGVPRKTSVVKLILVQDRELKITGSLMYTKEDFLIALNILTNYKIPFEKIITAIYDFDQTPIAFEHTLTNKNKNIKTLIAVGDYVKHNN